MALETVPVASSLVDTNLRKDLVVSETGQGLNGRPGPTSPVQTVAGQHGCRVLPRRKDDRGLARTLAWLVPA